MRRIRSFAATAVAGITGAVFGLLYAEKAGGRTDLVSLYKAPGGGWQNDANPAGVLLPKDVRAEVMTDNGR
jgi:hypothetical protein